jgi:aspartate aminotransferase
MTSFHLNSHFQQHQALSPTLQINERVQQLWAEGRTVYHFGFGESRFPVQPKVLAALYSNAQRKGYLPVQGLPELREAIAEYHGRFHPTPISPDHVIVAPGSKAILFALLMALDGDLLLPTPSWVSYAPQARLLGKPVHFIPAPVANGYALSIEKLDETVQQCQSASKILIINSPNNPTGRMLTAEFLQELSTYCRENQILVISDEIYGRVVDGRSPHISLAQYSPEGTIILGGLSKHLSLGGWRLGQAILSPEMVDLMPTLRSIASEIWTSVSAPVQYAATVAYSGDPDIEAYIADCARLHRIRSQHIWSWLVELGIQCAQPQGGFYMMPNFDRWREPLAQNGITTSAELAHFLLDKYQLALLPGSAFGVPTTELSLRLATSFVDMETDEKAEALLAAWQSQPDESIMTTHHPVTAQAIVQFQKLIDDLGG